MDLQDQLDLRVPLVLTEWVTLVHQDLRARQVTRDRMVLLGTLGPLVARAQPGHQDLWDPLALLDHRAPQDQAVSLALVVLMDPQGV